MDAHCRGESGKVHVSSRKLPNDEILLKLAVNKRLLMAKKKKRIGKLENLVKIYPLPF